MGWSSHPATVVANRLNIARIRHNGGHGIKLLQQAGKISSFISIHCPNAPRLIQRRTKVSSRRSKCQYLSGYADNLFISIALRALQL